MKAFPVVHNGFRPVLGGAICLKFYRLAPERAFALIALDDALRELASFDERKRQNCVSSVDSSEMRSPGFYSIRHSPVVRRSSNRPSYSTLVRIEQPAPLVTAVWERCTVRCYRHQQETF